MKRFRVYYALLGLAVIVLFAALAAPRFRAADSLPSQLEDAQFWKLIEGSSEPSGAFQSENFLSNETGFQAVIPTLERTTEPDGVYLGVGPEQNFTYIAALRPKIAFIIDIRRQNMLEHMIYKALFELSSDRADFLSRLFSRARPVGLADRPTIDELLNAYSDEIPDDDAFRANLESIKDVLLRKHKFALTAEDQSDIEHIYSVFRFFGPNIDYNSGAVRGFGGGSRAGGMPNYMDLMTATDPKGVERSYLATEENYRRIRDMEGRNLIVPLTGDFGGPKAIRAVGKYLKDHNAIVTAFYLSNVEQYLFQGNGNQNGGWQRFYDNVATLPLDRSSTFIRSVGGGRGRGAPGGFGARNARGMRAPNVLSSIQEIVSGVKAGRITTYYDVLSLSK